jgi:hypothetical protein
VTAGAAGRRKSEQSSIDFALSALFLRISWLTQNGDSYAAATPPTQQAKARGVSGGCCLVALKSRCSKQHEPAWCQQTDLVTAVSYMTATAGAHLPEEIQLSVGAAARVARGLPAACPRGLSSNCDRATD